MKMHTIGFLTYTKIKYKKVIKNARDLNFFYFLHTHKKGELLHLQYSVNVKIRPYSLETS